MKISHPSLLGTKKLFFIYFTFFLVGIFIVVYVTLNLLFGGRGESSIGENYTSLAPIDELTEDITLGKPSTPSGEGRSSDLSNVATGSQVIVASEVVTSEMVTKIRTPNLNSAPRKIKTSVASDKGIEVPVQKSTDTQQYIFRLQASPAQATRLRRLLEKVVISPKLHDKVTPLAVEIVDDREEPRGRMTIDSVSIVVSIPSESESIRVFVHELGHIIDIHYLQENLFGVDASDAFYAISWKDHQIKKPGQSYENFVSGYAMTNKYEDFAESFSEYVFANEHFRALAKNNASLRKKYDFFKKNLFKNDEFASTSFELGERKTYIWDTTKMAIAVNKYLYYIK